MFVRCERLKKNAPTPKNFIPSLYLLYYAFNFWLPLFIRLSSLSLSLSVDPQWNSCDVGVQGVGGKITADQ